MEFSKPGYMAIVIGIGTGGGSTTGTGGGSSTPLVTIEKITLKTNSEDKMVKTLLLGVAGYSDGAQHVEFDFTGAIPLAGFEADFAGACLGHQTCDITHQLAGITVVSRGRILTTQSETQTEAPNNISGNFSGFVLNRSRT